MQKITTHLWFDKEAKEAAKLYVSAFGGKNSRMINTSTLHNTPSGSVDIVTIELLGQEFTLISAGPLFKFNPSVSFLVACRTKDQVGILWRKLSKGGAVLMELGSYPFSEKYGWLSDRYGVSWQIMYAGRIPRQKITPVLMFVGPVCGKAENAVNFYMSVFSARGGHDSKILNIQRYSKDEKPDKEGTVKYAAFTLENKEFGAMDSAYPHKFAFNEAISFMVHCKNQKEIDYYWKKLSAVPEAEQCGWLKDKYGLSWQIVPTGMDEMMQTKDKKKLARVTEAFLKMKKFDLATLQAVYDQN